MSTSHVPADSFSTPNASQLDSQSRRHVGWGFWLLWTLATAAGWSVGIIVYSTVQFAIATVFASILVSLLLVSLGTIVGGTFGGIIATAFGFTQGFLLKQYGYSIRQYTKASLIGGIIGGAISAVAIILLSLLLEPIGIKFHWLYSQDFVFLTDALFLAMCGLVTGVVIGYRQRRVLPDPFRFTLRWALINAFGWAIGCAIIVPASWLLYGKTVYPFFGIIGNYAGQGIITTALCGLVGGAITGYPLMRALQQSRIGNLNESSSSRLG